MPGGSFYRHAGGGGKRDRRVGTGPFDAVSELERVRLACGRGEHDRRTARAGYVTYAPGGRRVTPGDSYCGYCGVPLPPE